MATIKINGVTYSGNNIEVIGTSVSIDGKPVDGTFKSPLEVRVVEGVLHELKADGSVICGHVTGNVTAGGSVNCDDIDGNVTAGGSVNADEITNPKATIMAGGSVRIG